MDKSVVKVVDTMQELDSKIYKDCLNQRKKMSHIFMNNEITWSAILSYDK
jgi:hypothetical protein